MRPCSPNRKSTNMKNKETTSRIRLKSKRFLSERATTKKLHLLKKCTLIWQQEIPSTRNHLFPRIRVGKQLQETWNPKIHFGWRTREMLSIEIRTMSLPLRHTVKLLSLIPNLSRLISIEAWAISKSSSCRKLSMTATIAWFWCSQSYQIAKRKNLNPS